MSIKTVRAKIMGSFAIIVLLTLSLGIVSIIQIKKLTGTLVSM